MYIDSHLSFYPRRADLPFPTATSNDPNGSDISTFGRTPLPFALSTVGKRFRKRRLSTINKGTNRIDRGRRRDTETIEMEREMSDTDGKDREDRDEETDTIR